MHGCMLLYFPPAYAVLGRLWARELGQVRQQVTSVTAGSSSQLMADTVVDLVSPQLSDPPVDIPLHSSEHFYVVTKPMEGTCTCMCESMEAIIDHCRKFCVGEL